MASSSSGDDVTKRKHAEFEERCGTVEENKMGSANEHRRRSYSREDTPPAPCSVLCGPRSCSTLPSSLHHSNDCGTSPPEPKRRRLWGLRGLVKMFRRRVRRKGGDDPSGSPQGPPPTLRARSASEIAVDPCNRSSSGPYNQGLSVSHDSVFSPESPTEQSHNVPPSLALATRGVNMSELKAALRRRRGEDSGSGDEDHDPGLPRSPHTSPTTLDVLNHGLKSYSRTTQSTCSDGSLLSMGSSENDEDSFGALSHHSSRASLIESRYQVVDHEPAAGIVHLSHKAAMHKISVRPKRSHGIPHAKRKPQAIPTSLPTTPEVNEDNSARNNYSDLTGSQKASTPVSVLTRHSTSSIPTKALYSAKNEFKTEEVRETARKTSSTASFNVAREERKEETHHVNRLSSSGYSNQLPGVEDGRQHRRSAGNSSYVEEKLTNDFVEEQQKNFETDDNRKWSGEKRKDPFRASSGSKSSRQKSDPSRLSNREDEVTESEKEDKNGAYRSASVEGRLEGHLFEEISMSRKSYIASVPTHQAIKDVLARGRQSRQEEFHRERMENINDEEPSAINTSSDYPEFIMKERTDSVEKRLSSSYNYLESGSKEDITKKQKTHSVNSLDSCESSTSTLGGRSSTDSLTTTPLPGIYIRSSQSKSSRTSYGSSTQQSKPVFDHSPNWRDEDFEISSGPLSLDSSLTVVQISQQDEEKIRKAFSVDVMGGKGSNISEPSRKSHDFTTSVDQSFASKSASVFRSVSVHSPGSTISNIRSRKSSLGDELDSDSSLQSKPLRPMKREASVKKSKTEEHHGTVPEFMRIQLNRVDSKANSVIFDTESETSKVVTKTPPTVLPTKISKTPPPDFEKVRKISSLRKEEFEQSRECSEIVVEDRIAVKASKLRSESLLSSNSPDKDFSQVLQAPKKAMPDNTTINVTNDIKAFSPSVSSGNVPIEPSNEPSKEEIILRRPSVLDRSAVLDQAVIGSQISASAPVNRQDQPELFKVFARRSFKLKDVELEAAQSNLHVEPDTKNEATKEINCGIYLDEPKTEEPSGLITKEIVNELTKNLPTLRSISSKRYSVGSCATANSVSPEQKQTVIVVAGNLKKEQYENESPANFVKQDIRVKNVDHPIPFIRSQSLTPSPKVEFNVKKPSNTFHSESATSSGSDGDDQGTPVRKDSEFISKPLPTPVRTHPQSNSSLESSNNSNTKLEGTTVNSPFSSAIIRRSITPNFNKLSTSPSNSIPESSSLETPTINIVNNNASKPVVTRVQSVVWPPRSQPNESKTDSTESLDVSDVGVSSSAASTVSVTPPSRSSLPPSKILSSFSESVSESQSVKVFQTIGDVQNSKKEEASSTVLATRRRIISGGVGNQINSLPESTDASPPLLAEARNTSVSHTFDAQSPIGLTIGKISPVSASKDEKSDEESSQSYQSHRNSIGGSEDWRVLVRQRREDRMKQTKTQDSEEIIMETRPNVSRNSKVLEMASNFQKLQVA